MIKNLIASLFCIAAVLSAGETWPRQGTVTGKELTIRGQPGVHFDSLGSFRRGESVTVVSQKDNWYEVILPERIEAWVAADAIDENGEILQDKCPLYAGPGIMFCVFARIPRGTKLQVIPNEIIQWRLIKVPEGVTAWVNSAFVQLDESAEEQQMQQMQQKLLDAEKQKEEANAKLAEAESALSEAQQKQSQAQEALAASLATLAEIEARAKEAEQKRIEMEQKLKDDTEKADAAARAAELLIIKQTAIDQEKNSPEYAESTESIQDLKNKIADMQKQLEEAQKAAEEKERVAKQELQGIENQISEKKAELQKFQKPQEFQGVVVGLGEKATASASHILYDANRRPVCFLNSRRIPLNQWVNMRVSLSGNIQHPEGWQLPLVTVTDIIIQ